MRKSLNVVGILIIGLLAIPAIAQAGFFNDGRWYMDSSRWEENSLGDVSGTELADRNGRLEWNTGSGWDDGHEAIRAYASKWAFDLKDDFEFSVGFNYGHISTQYPNDYGTVVTGLFYGVGGSYAFATGASSDVDYNNTPVKEFWTSMAVPGEPIEEDSWNRTYDDGVFYAYYDSLEDNLRFSAEGGAADYTGLREELGLTQLGVFFAGGSSGASLVSGDAYLQNFQVIRGTMTPEPVSTILFLTGGALVGGRLLIRKRRQEAGRV